MLGARVHPLEEAVRQIVADPQYLTSEQTDRLRRSVPSLASDDTEVVTLRTQISSQMRMMEKLQSLALSSTDIAEVAKVMTAGKDLVAMLGKYSDELDSQSRQIHVEAAIAAALDSVEVSIKEKYLKTLARELAKPRAS